MDITQTLSVKCNVRVGYGDDGVLSAKVFAVSPYGEGGRNATAEFEVPAELQAELKAVLDKILSACAPTMGPAVNDAVSKARDAAKRLGEMT